MTTTKRKVSPRRNAAPAARHLTIPAPVLVAGRSLIPAPTAAAADTAERLHEQLGRFTELDSLCAGILALLSPLPSPDPRVKGAVGAIEHAAAVNDGARDRIDSAAIGKPEGDLADLLRATACELDAFASLLGAARDLLSATEGGDTSLPMLHACTLIVLAREHAGSIAELLREQSASLPLAQVAA